MQVIYFSIQCLLFFFNPKSSRPNPIILLDQKQKPVANSFSAATEFGPDISTLREEDFVPKKKDFVPQKEKKVLPVKLTSN